MIKFYHKDRHRKWKQNLETKYIYSRISMLMVVFILKQFLADFTSTSVYKRKSVGALVKFNDNAICQISIDISIVKNLILAELKSPINI